MGEDSLLGLLLSQIEQFGGSGMNLRRRYLAWIIRRRLKRAPYFEDFLNVRDRKGSSLACYLQERVRGDLRWKRFHRRRHFEGRRALG